MFGMSRANAVMNRELALPIAVHTAYFGATKGQLVRPQINLSSLFLDFVFLMGQPCFTMGFTTDIGKVDKVPTSKMLFSAM